MHARRTNDGFTLIEALVALAIVAMVVITFLGIRTTALVDTMHARNWRLAREIAEERMSELKAGAHEVRPESGQVISLAERYQEGWSYKILIGETAVTEAESELADAATGSDPAASERAEWEQNREQYRRANAAGMSYLEYQDKLYEDETARRLEETAPSANEYEEVAVVVYFPKLDPEHPTDQDSLMIKARISTLAISGMTPDQAEALAESRGQATSGSGAGSNPFGTQPGGDK